jgi:hypothetical protein
MTMMFIAVRSYSDHDETSAVEVAGNRAWLVERWVQFERGVGTVKWS